MSKNLALSFKIDADTAAAIAKVQAFQRQLTAAQGVQPIADPFSAVRSGASSTSAGLGGVLAGIAAVAAAAAGLGLAFKKGLDINAETESATLGIKSLVAALTTIKDESGNVVTDLGKKIAISGTIAEDEITKLRIAGLETSATFKQLLGAFQQGIGAGSSAGLSLEKIRELTIGITQAAGALGMPMDQLNQEVRSLLSGDITADSTVAKALGITKTQVDGWREAGTLAENLNKRLEVFKVLGAESGQTWTATLSNVSDAFSLLLGEMSKGSFDGLKRSIQSALSEAFDVKTAGISASLDGIKDIGTDAFGAIGTVLQDALEGGVTAAKELSAWFTQHADEVAVVKNTIGLIYEGVKSVVTSVVSVVAAMAGVAVEGGLVYGVLGTIALLVAAIQDGLQLWKGLLADVGGYILDKVGGPLRTVLASFRDFLAAIPGIGPSLAAAVDGILRAIPTSGAGLRAVAKGIQADFDASRTAVARTTAELSKTGAEIRAQNSERAREARRGVQSAPGGTSSGKKAAPEGDKAKKAADAYAAALLSYAAAETEAQKKVSQSLKEVAEADLERSLQSRLVSQEAYLLKKSALEKAALAQEVAAARAQASLLAKTIEGEKDPAKKRKLEGDLLKVKAEITSLENKSVVIDTKLQLNIEAFKREVESLRIDIKSNILDLEGNAFGSGKTKLEQETKTLLEDPRVRDDAALTAAVNRQAQLKEQQLQLTEQKRLSDERVQYLSLAEERIALQVQTGQLTAIEAERKVREARLGTADAILAQVAALEALAAANPQNSEMALGAVRARLEFDKLKTTLDATATSINRELAGGVSGLVEGLARGEGAIKSLGAAMSNVFGSLAKRVLKNFEDMLFSALEGKNGQGLGGMLSQFIGGASSGGGGGGGASLLAGIGSLFGFAGGGWTGPGGKYQPKGIVHGDEFVFTKAEVQRAGLPFFYGLKNQISRGPRMSGYAEGGLVGGGFTGVAAAMPAPQVTNQNYNHNYMYTDMDDVARKLGRNPIFGRDVSRVVFEDNASKLGR